MGCIGADACPVLEGQGDPLASLRSISASYQLSVISYQLKVAHCNLSRGDLMKSMLADKSFKFSVRIIGLARYVKSQKEFELARQILKSGTSIGANIAEAQRAQSDKDFLSKMYIAAKEANETEYWLRLFREVKIISDKEFYSIHDNLKEIIKMLVSTTKSLESKLKS